MKLYLYGALAIVMLAITATAYIQTKRLHSAKVELATATATIKAERESTRKANEASNAYQADLRRLESERSNVPVVRLCKQTRKAPVSPTSSGSDAAPTGHVSEEAPPDPGPDIGADLLEYGIACEANMLQLDRLQKWVRDR
jgi:hypothetical protein